MQDRTELRAIVVDRFPAREVEAMALVDEALECEVGVEALRHTAAVMPDFEAWRHEMREWIDWVKEGS